jgi:hypothetical protein
MAQLIFYTLLLLLYVGFSNAENSYGISAYVSPSILLDNKLFVEVDQEIRFGFRFFDASSLNTNSKTIQYQNLQYTTNPPNVLASRVVANKDKLFFYGIDGEDPLFASTVMYSFDIKKKIWTRLMDVDMPVIMNYKQEEPFVGPDSEGNAYLLYNGADTMLSFNTESLKWNEHIIQSFVPAGMNYYSWYTATMLPDGKIVYIGGRFGNDNNDTNLMDAPMEQVYVYDTKTNVWSAELTNGIIPGARFGHSASLTSDGRIIIYGGMDVNSKAADPALAVLDTTTPKYTWSSPEVTNPIGSVLVTPSVMVDNFMILYAGLNSTRIQRYFDKVFMLDTTTYTWYTLDPVGVNPKENIYVYGGSELVDGNDITFKLMIALIVISSLHILLLLGFAFYKLYKSRYSKRNKVMVTP